MGIRELACDGMMFGQAAILGFRWMIVVALPYPDTLEPSSNASRLRSLTDLTASVHNSLLVPAQCRPNHSNTPSRPVPRPPTFPPSRLPPSLNMTLPSPKRACPRPSHDAPVPLGEPPYKRPKTHHAPYSLSTSQPCGSNTISPPIAFLPTCDQSPRPLTSCASNCNEVPEPQALGDFQSVLSLPFDHRMPRGLDYASLSGNPTAPSRTDAAPPDNYIPQDEAFATSPSNSPPSPASSRPGPPMIFSFGPEVDSPTFSGQYTTVTKERHLVSPDWGTRDLGPLWDPFYNINYSQLPLPGSLVGAVDPLRVDNSNHPTQQNDPPSPLSRSMSRSSFASSSYAGDYPTPTSDSTAVTTPAPSEGCIGSPSEHPQVLFGQDFLLAVEAKKGEHEHSYVSGSATFSPTTFTLNFSHPQATSLPPTSNAVPLSTARRHSEPANLAACNFPSFFVQCHEASSQVMSVPGDSMTHSIADNLVSLTSASASHSVPSSIAPHQTQLPTLLHPRPVRAFKPQILLSELHYDPKDFIRRRSEPIIPLPELDVSSHIPLDVVAEDDEDEESMEVEDSCLFEEVAEEGCDEQAFDLFGEDGSWTGTESENFFSYNDWSWLQSVSSGPQPAQQAAFVIPPSQVPVSYGAAGWNMY
ncbi:hypothetical protein GSI_06208 [Ganoderma sinense ZZ0214-1]|uniref:Uncharacterized protein n=1 Tax=Ganoderma sinense ZZ0214-1 TaxID=1077348 RepID=A0A2G8SCK5_9APHY|nr:hypothetical protein GSI_06208 [Ganoderma sinense ZZ0214-1]